MDYFIYLPDDLRKNGSKINFSWLLSLWVWKGMKIGFETWPVKITASFLSAEQLLFCVHMLNLLSIYIFDFCSAQKWCESYRTTLCSIMLFLVLPSFLIILKNSLTKRGDVKNDVQSAWPPSFLYVSKNTVGLINEHFLLGLT